jgi:histone H3/H4
MSPPVEVTSGSDTDSPAENEGVSRTIKKRDASLVVTARIKSVLHGSGMHGNAKLAAALSDSLNESIQAGISCAKLNGRKTVRENDVVVFNVGHFIAHQGVAYDAETIEAMRAKCEQMVERAAQRAKSNGRKSIMPFDV